MRRIFREYAKGRSRSQIAKLLNAEGVPWPTAHKPQKLGGWTSNTIRAFLQNERYAGTWRYREKEFTKLPGSNRVIVRKRDPSEVLTFERPHLRIIDPDLWSAVQERSEAMRRKYSGRGKKTSDERVIAGNKSSYLLTGLLVCGVCGGLMDIRAGRTHRYYRCAANRKKGICPNKRSIREDVARPAFLESIRERLMSPDGIAYVRKRLATELGQMSQRLETQLAEHRARLANTEQWIQRLIARSTTAATRPAAGYSPSWCSARSAGRPRPRPSDPGGQPPETIMTIRRADNGGPTCI